MIRRTRHGENIADQIPGEDAYGYTGTLTLTDVYYILDAIHTNFMDADRDNAFISRWMEELVNMGHLDI